MRSISILVLFAFVVLMAGAAFGFGIGLFEDSGNPLWIVAGVAVSMGIFYGAYRFRPKSEESREILDLTFGDMSDPVQRAIMIRMTVAAMIHSIGLVLLIGRESDVSTVNLSDGIAQTEVGTLLVMALFVLGMFWMVYEAWRFYTIDEFWRNLSSGPFAAAGVVLFVFIIIWLVASEYLGAPDVSVLPLYAIYWGSAMTMFYRSKKARG